MAQIVSIHSYRGGTGKSNLTANVAATVAAAGKRVAIVDTDIQSPGIHVLFNLEEGQMTRALNDYLYGRCTIQETAYDVTPPHVAAAGGNLRLVPSSIKPGEIAKVLREGYDVGMMNEGFQDLVESLALDYLFIDTHPGLNEETLLSIAVSDVLIILLRPDRQDFQGTAVTVDVARKLEVRKLYVIVNKALTRLDFDALRRQVADTYGAPVIGVFPESEDMLALGSAGLFCLHHPDHPITDEIKRVAGTLLEGRP